MPGCKQVSMAMTTEGLKQRTLLKNDHAEPLTQMRFKVIGF